VDASAGLWKRVCGFCFFLGFSRAFCLTFIKRGEGHSTFHKPQIHTPNQQKSPLPHFRHYFHLLDPFPTDSCRGWAWGRVFGFFLGGAKSPKTRKDFVWPPSAFFEGRCVTVAILCPVHSPRDIPPHFHAHVCCVRMGSSSSVAWAIGGRGLLRCVVVVVGWDKCCLRREGEEEAGGS